MPTSYPDIVVSYKLTQALIILCKTFGSCLFLYQKFDITPFFFRFPIPLLILGQDGPSQTFKEDGCIGESWHRYNHPPHHW